MIEKFLYLETYTLWCCLFFYLISFFCKLS